MSQNFCGGSFLNEINNPDDIDGFLDLDTPALSLVTVISVQVERLKGISRCTLTFFF